MRSPLQRIRTGAIVLAAIFVVAVIGFHTLGNYDWLDALWMTVVTISTVGYAEHSASPPALQLFTIGVILAGMTAATLTIVGFIQLMLAGELQNVLGYRRMTRDLQALDRHVIVCGYGRIGTILAGDLHRHQRPFVVIDQSPRSVESARERGYLCLEGDATEEETLRAAGIARARTLFSGLPDDADNVFITLTARELQPGIVIIARAEHPSTEKKLRQAGADKVLLPSIIGAHHVERMITRPLTADLIEKIAETRFPELELDEVPVTGDSSLVGTTVQETEARKQFELLVLAIQQADQTIKINPEAAYALQAGDVLTVLGSIENIRRFRDRYQT